MLKTTKKKVVSTDDRPTRAAYDKLKAEYDELVKKYNHLSDRYGGRVK